MSSDIKLLKNYKNEPFQKNIEWVPSVNLSPKQEAEK
jgi:hypothetical protein